MRQAVRDVVYIIAVVVLSAVAALLIGWILAGCDPGDENGGIMEESDNTTDYDCIKIGSVCWDSEDVTWTTDYQVGSSACSESEKRLPTASEVELLWGDCSDYLFTGSADIHCGDCVEICDDLELAEYERHWTSTVATGVDDGYVWTYIPGESILRPSSIANFGRTRCVSDI